ncbi:cyclopropane-fatty-acyl-phospholipid synthase [Steroidobacter agaridevorans]|uniref:Cyclopropane-fatty-acyl-phospholipid synthase n=2 Tax=Steroidobacter agaridevorans TaxID=2695856 RepID=A0A829YK07_9GAMM|nr:cyclopropane-fatty-acyl-phospholipid synthase family protein [Steroidobacter agaridevorans]GFE83744.1 cyclopropane-fatty-acyl-phospholipid synthase [Steroidobacter agaridevorans]
MQTSQERPMTTFRVADSAPPGPARHDSSSQPDPAPHLLSIESRMLRALLHAFGDPPVQLALWNGERVGAPDAVATLHIPDRATLMRLCRDPDLQFGELYSIGKIQVEGDIGRLIEVLYQGSARPGRNSISALRRVGQWLHRRPANTLHGSRENIHHHYDIGNEFYSLWLGSTMAYTCAYFPTPDATLDEAQNAKMEHVCRKLQLRPGQTVAEAGCGWGGLALYMARHHGVKVRAFNISREQIAFARERAKAQGLENNVEFVEDDYRNIRGQYDAFVSVGMLEHVGVENYPGLGEVVRGCLKPEGLGLIHTIGRNRWKPMHRWIDRRIFPGANPPSLKQMMEIFEDAEFSVLDVENLRLHYAKTLDWWWRLYEESRDQVERMFDANFVRMWRLYLAGSRAAFVTGEMQLFQVVFSAGANNKIPMTREHLYRP